MNIVYYVILSANDCGGLKLKLCLHVLNTFWGQRQWPLDHTSSHTLTLELLWATMKVFEYIITLLILAIFNL